MTDEATKAPDANDVDEVLCWDDVHHSVQKLVKNLLWHDATKQQRQELYEVVYEAIKEWRSWQVRA